MKAKPLMIPPQCPFCGDRVARPAEPVRRKMGDSLQGRCQCGALYVSDPTGHNVGSAMVECLVSACNDNWDLAWDLVPGDDYLTGRLEDYDEVTHQVVETRNHDGRAVRGVLYFIRLHEDALQSVDATDVTKQRSSGLVREREPEPDPARYKHRVSKKEVFAMVEAADEDGLVRACFDDKRTLLFLQRLLYDLDPDRRWRTIDMMGRVCGRLATRRPGQVSDCLHRLFAAADDSAAVSWGAIEAIGAIIAGEPRIFGAFTGHIVPHAGHGSSLEAALWALGTIAAASPDVVRKAVFYPFLAYLDHEMSAVRGLATRLFGNMAAVEILSRLEALQDDDALVTYYENGQAVVTTVGMLARWAVAALKKM